MEKRHELQLWFWGLLTALSAHVWSSLSASRSVFFGGGKFACQEKQNNVQKTKDVDLHYRRWEKFLSVKQTRSEKLKWHLQVYRRLTEVTREVWNQPSEVRWSVHLQRFFHYRYPMSIHITVSLQPRPGINMHQRSE